MKACWKFLFWVGDGYDSDRRIYKQRIKAEKAAKEYAKKHGYDEEEARIEMCAPDTDPAGGHGLKSHE